MERGEPVKIAEGEIDRFLEEEKITSDYYRYILNKFLRSKGEFSEEAVRDFVSSYDKKSSRNTALSILRSLAEWKRGKIPPMGEDNQLKRWTLEKTHEYDGGDNGNEGGAVRRSRSTSWRKFCDPWTARPSPVSGVSSITA